MTCSSELLYTEDNAEAAMLVINRDRTIAMANTVHER